MRAFLNTLLLIALLVQLPFSAFAAYSDLNHSQAQHQTSEDHDHPHTNDAPHSTSTDDYASAAGCITHHHCTGTHLSSLPQSELE